MRIETRTEFEPTRDGVGARIWVVVVADGQEHRYVHTSGPHDDVKAYHDGMLTLKELRRRWNISDSDPTYRG